MNKSFMSVLAALAVSTAAVAPAFAHDVIISRPGFDTALASIQMASAPQDQSSDKSQSVNDVTVGDTSGHYDITKTVFSSDRWLKAND